MTQSVTAAPWSLKWEVYKFKASPRAVEQDPVSRSQGWGWGENPAKNGELDISLKKIYKEPKSSRKLTSLLSHPGDVNQNHADISHLCKPDTKRAG